MKGKIDQARVILKRIGGDEYAESEIKAIAPASVTEVNSGFKMLFKHKYSKILVLGIVITMFQQWCGTNVIFNYAQEIFQSAGYKVGDVLFNIVITGVANVIFTIVALFTVDRWGRRVLMLVGAGGLAGIYILLGAWDEFSPNLYSVEMNVANKKDIDSKSITFGCRDWAVRDTTLYLNNHPVFMRGTLHCAAFPLTGYPSTDKNEWLREFKIMKEYGLNHDAPN